ncbi:MAG: DinB family protein [Acidobacteria bacterium]|nr:DinB family protein [Acidobacteriota bacterium]
MIPLAVFQRLFDYNWWARDRQLEACAALTTEQFLRPLGSSFSSVRDTLAHLVGVEWLYLERWHGRSPRALPTPQGYPTVATLRQRWAEVEQQLRHCLARTTDAELAETLTFTTMRGEPRTTTRWETLYHLLNHQSYHRGQVTTLLRQLGAAPAAVDFYVFLDARR